jgi:hypothetical protein
MHRTACEQLPGFFASFSTRLTIEVTAACVLGLASVLPDSENKK